MALPPFAALKAFEAVGRLRGFRRAANDLNVSHAIISRHVSQLETHLGVILIDRKSGTLTATGAEYHGRITTAISELEAATHAVKTSQGAKLVIWCSAGFALHWLTRRLPRFGKRSEGIIVDLHSTDGEPALHRGEADGDIRYLGDGGAPRSRTDIQILELARPAVYPVASPKFLAKLVKPIEGAADLRACSRIEEGSDDEWTRWLAGQGVNGPLLEAPVAQYGQAHLTVAAARAGQGIALSNDFLASEDLAEGRLVRITPAEGRFADVVLGGYVLRGYRARWHDPRLLQFRNWLKAEIARDTAIEG